MTGRMNEAYIIARDQRRIAETLLISPYTLEESIALLQFGIACGACGISLDKLRAAVLVRYPHHARRIAQIVENLSEQPQGA